MGVYYIWTSWKFLRSLANFDLFQWAFSMPLLEMFWLEALSHLKEFSRVGVQALHQAIDWVSVSSLRLIFITFGLID